jgi:cytochrome c553
MSRRIVVVVMLILLSSASWRAWGDLSARLVVPGSDIKFSHAFHAGQQEIDCLTCHPSVDTSKTAQDKNLPTMEVCGACHDVEDDKNCGQCHRNPDDPLALPNPVRPIFFNHQRHLSQKTACNLCHGDVGLGETLTEASMPKMALCFTCHDGAKAPGKCEICHGQRIGLADIHPSDWRHQHPEKAASNRAWCTGCHRTEVFCLNCHRGDNLTGSIHDLNFLYTHGLDANDKEADCTRCHDRKEFCNACHESRSRMPLGHSALSWVTNHGEAARRDVESCASCHDASDPTCGRAGCHNDFDGIRGTDPVIHPPGRPQFDSEGPWHHDDGYFCHQCHRNTHSRGSGFCGYCHQ